MHAYILHHQYMYKTKRIGLCINVAILCMFVVMSDATSRHLTDLGLLPNVLSPVVGGGLGGLPSVVGGVGNLAELPPVLGGSLIGGQNK